MEESAVWGDVEFSGFSDRRETVQEGTPVGRAPWACRDLLERAGVAWGLVVLGPEEPTEELDEVEEAEVFRGVLAPLGEADLAGLRRVRFRYLEYPSGQPH